MKIVSVVNRTNEKFYFKWDGQGYTIPPGPKPYPMTETVAYHAVRKSLYGVDPYTNKGGFKIGIEGVHDCTMLDEIKEKNKLKSHLDMSRIESVEGKKFGEKQLDNPLEISEGARETTKVGFTGTPEGK